MRVKDYILERNIGLVTVNRLCEFLQLNPVKINAKLSKERIEILDLTFGNKVYQEWIHNRLSLERIEIEEAQFIIKPLFYNSTIQIDELLGERILNSLILLINKGYYSRDKLNLLQISSTDKIISDKISLLKSSNPFVKPKLPSEIFSISKKFLTNVDDNSELPSDEDQDIKKDPKYNLDDIYEESEYDLDDHDSYFEEDDKTESDIDHYEDFHWGGLHGEEAYTGYWNTD